MKKLKTIEEIQEALASEELHPPQATLSDLMKDKIYECGCGESHAVDKAIVGAACRGRSIAHSGVGKGFILVCNTHATLVVTEGIFNYTFKSIWTFDKNLMPGQFQLEYEKTMPLVDRDIVDWEGRERSIEGLAEFFNNYQIPFFGFGNSDKNKQLYLKQMAEVNEFVGACLIDLIYDKKEEKIYNDILAMKAIELELIKKDLVTEKKIQQVKDNLLHIYKESSFASLESAEAMAYGGFKEIRKVIVLLNHDKFDGLTSYDDGDFAELK